MRDVLPIDRPREKLAVKGPAGLTDLELLQILIGSGVPGADVNQIARDIKRLLKKEGGALTLDDLSAVKGVSLAKASNLLAAFELARRHLGHDDTRIVHVDDLLALLSDIRDKRQEYLVCLSLDGGNRLLAKRTVTIGTLNASLVHPREVFAAAVADRAASVVVAHNHPSDNPCPSPEDIEVIRRLKYAGEIIGITLQDHLIVTKKDFYSFKTDGAL